MFSLRIATCYFLDIPFIKVSDGANPVSVWKGHTRAWETESMEHWKHLWPRLPLELVE